MINELENYQNFASKSDLEFLLCFYVAFKNVDNDPISVELHFETIAEIGKQYKIEISEESLLNLMRALKVINYDIQTKIIKILPNDYAEILKILKKPRKRMDEENSVFEKNNYVIKNESYVKNYLSPEELITILKEMYENAPDGYQMTMVHLFGIKYAEQLKGKKVKDIAITATGKDSLYVEIGKGIKLANYVKLNDKNLN